MPNAADRLATVNGTAVSHDANGEVTADETGGAYTWDVRGRLVGISRPGLTASFGYRQDGLRTSKTLNGPTTAFLLNGDSIVSETGGGVTTPVLQGPGTDQPLARGGKWLVSDQLGNTVALTDGGPEGQCGASVTPAFTVEARKSRVVSAQTDPAPGGAVKAEGAALAPAGARR